MSYNISLEIMPTSPSQSSPIDVCMHAVTLLLLACTCAITSDWYITGEISVTPNNCNLSAYYKKSYSCSHLVSNVPFGAI